MGKYTATAWQPKHRSSPFPGLPWREKKWKAVKMHLRKWQYLCHACKQRSYTECGRRATIKTWTVIYTFTWELSSSPAVKKWNYTPALHAYVTKLRQTLRVTECLLCRMFNFDASHLIVEQWLISSLTDIYTYTVNKHINEKLVYRVYTISLKTTECEKELWADPCDVWTDPVAL